MFSDVNFLDVPDMKSHFRTKVDVANTWIYWAKTCYNVINVNNSVVFLHYWATDRRDAPATAFWAGSLSRFWQVLLPLCSSGWSGCCNAKQHLRSSLDIPPPVWRFRPPGFYPPRLWEGGVAAIFPPSPVLMSLELSSSISPMTTTATSPSRPRSQLTLFLLAGRQEREREKWHHNLTKLDFLTVKAEIWR